MTRLGEAIARAEQAESGLAAAFAGAAAAHEDEPDVAHLCRVFAEEAEAAAGRLAALGASGAGAGAPPAFLADLTALFLRVQEAWILATCVRQGALAARDREAIAAADSLLEQTTRQASWLQTRIKTTAPQALSVE